VTPSAAKAELGRRHATVLGGTAVLDGQAAVIVAYLVRTAQRMLRADSLEEMLEQLQFPPEQAAAARQAQAALVLAAESWQRDRASADFLPVGVSLEAHPHSNGCATSLSVPVAAELLNVTPRRVRQLAAAGRIEGTRGLQGWQLDPASVQEFAQARAAA
jgi:hypothetical protein